jgi:hypothetical protein
MSMAPAPALLAPLGHALSTDYAGTETMQTLIVGRDITGISAFP